MKRRLIILDTTLREGEQAPGSSMQPHVKVTIAKLLEKLNVDVIEAGFAASSLGDFLSIQAIAREVKRPVISSFCRAREEDIDTALGALKKARRKRLNIVFGTSDLHLKYKFKITRSGALDRVAGSVKYARKFCADVQFSAEDVGRTDKNFLIKMIDTAVKAGASTINLADTVGFLVPEEMGALIKFVRERIATPDRTVLSVHIHDDLGLSLASSLEAIEAGVDQVECTISGVGDRAGICALQKLFYVLKIRQDYFSVRTDIREKYLAPLSRLVGCHTGSK